MSAGGLALTAYAACGSLWVLAGVGVGLLIVGAVVWGLLVAAWRLPRLAYEDGWLLVYVLGRKPLRVPIDVVEVFFLGRGPALPRDECDERDASERDGREQGPQTANVVVRLADRAAEWHNRTVRPDVGKWSDGYIILRGAWCEPISHERLNELNRRLAEIHRQRRAAPAGDSSQRTT